MIPDVGHLFIRRTEQAAEPTQTAVTSTEKAASSSEVAAEPTRARADKLIAEGKKAIALQQWEEGVAKYADALDIMCVDPRSLDSVLNGTCAHLE